MHTMTLKSIVSYSAITLLPHQTLCDALDVMSRTNISSVIIIDKHNRPIGIFTEHDALRVVTETIDKQIAIEEMMTQNPFCVEVSMLLHDAYIIMENKGYRHLVIIDENGKFLGIVSEGDFLRHIGFDEASKTKTVAEAMGESPLVIDIHTSLIDTAKLMKERKCEYAIILDNMRPVGLITERDIVKHCASDSFSDTSSIISLLQNNFKIIKENTPIYEASALMKEHGVHQLIVVDEDEKLIGLLGRQDILRLAHGNYFEFLVHLINRKTEMINTLELRKEELHFEKSKAQEHTLKYRKLFDAIPDGVVLLDSQTLRAIEFNYLAHQHLGYSAEEFAELQIGDYEIIESDTEILKRVKNIVNNKYHQFETKHRKKNGEILDIQVNAIAIDIDEKPCMMAFYRDITKEKGNEITLQKQSIFIHSLLANIPNPVWVKDLNGIYLACNKMFERFIGASEAELIGKSDFDFVSHEVATSFRKYDEEAITAGVSLRNDEYLKFADGSHEGHFETIKTPMKNANGTIVGILGVSRDISERKRKDMEIEKIQSLAHVGTWSWDIVRDEFTGTAEAYRIFEIPQEKKLTLKELLEKFPAQDAKRVKEQLQQALNERKNVDSVYRLVTDDGTSKWIKTYTEFQYNEKHEPIKALGMFQDVTEQIQYEKKLEEKDRDLNQAEALAHIGSWRLNVTEDTLEWSAETYRIFGMEPQSSLPHDVFIEAIHPDDKENVALAWAAAIHGADYDIEHRIIVDGKIKWVHEHAKLEIDEDGNILTGVGMVQEITQRKLYEQELETLAKYDPLTGLANRSLLATHLKNIINTAKQSHAQVALLIFDLDRFKDINDSYGHNAGDELLQQVAQRFSKHVPAGNFISRLGGDEFAVALNNLAHPEDAGHFAQKMIEVIAENFKLSRDISVHIGASAGIVLYPDNALTAESLLQFGDAALYKSKAEGRETYRYYTDELTHLARERIECETDLRKAIINEEFEVYYQPQVHIASGRIIGAEALIRWNHPTKGLVPPIAFIPIAEDTGLIGDIGEWVLNETCRQGKIWLDRGHRFTLAVNLSAHQLRYQDVVAIVDNALKKSGFDASRLELELTESVLMQREEETVRILHSLRAKGIKLAIDDFGTGYSSLSYLKRFPIDILKIDKSFVDDVPFDADDCAIVSAIIAMGKALGYQILAEGVEQEEQLLFLQEKGCTLYQGYYKSKPLKAEEFEKLLQ